MNVAASYSNAPFNDEDAISLAIESACRSRTEHVQLEHQTVDSMFADREDHKDPASNAGDKINDE